MLYRQYDSDLNKLEHRLDSIKISTLPSIETSLWDFNDQQVQTTVDSLMNLDDVIRVEVRGFTWDGKPNNFIANNSKKTNNNVLQKTFPIIRNRNHKETRLGELYVVASLESVKQNLWDQTKFIVITQSIKTFIITSLILILIRNLFMRHLYTISKHTHTLTLHNGYNPLELDRKTPKSPDELDQVVDTLNEMHLSLIEEQKREIELEKDRAFAQATLQAKSEFLSHMSHEIRTPMNGVIGLLDLLDGDNLNTKQKRYLQLIQKSGQSLLSIINDILDLSKIEANKLNLSKTEFLIYDLINECTSIYTASALEKNITITENIQDDLKCVYLGDSLLIKQILLNLISTSDKHTCDGNITVQVQTSNTKPPKEGQINLQFSVKDSGTGIEDKNKNRIFEAFEQGDNESVSQGTGLGLSICKKLVDLMNGEIGLNSDLGEGSEFWFTIPVEVTKKTKLVEKEEQTLHNGQNSDFTNFADKKILAVEDNDVNQQVIESLLNSLGITPVVVSNGEEALKLITEKQRQFAIILMDCEMPIMDGFEASKRIRAFEKEHNKKHCIIDSLFVYHDQKHNNK